MSYNIEIHRSSEALDPAHWEVMKGLLPVSMDRYYLNVLENLHRGQIDFYYASITRNDNIVGLIYFQVVRFKGAYLRNFLRTDGTTGLFKRMLFAFISSILRFPSWNLMLAGNIFFTGERGAYFISGIPDEDIADLIHRSFEKARAEQKKIIHGYMLNNVYNDGPAYIQHYLNKFNYSVYPVDPDMFMHFNPSWKKFEDYASDLSSKYRVRLRKILKESASIDMRVLDADQMRSERQRIHELYMATAENVSFNLGYLDKCYFCEMKKLWGENFKFIAYFSGDSMVGFMSLLMVNSDVDVNYMGMDYDCNRDFKLYNRMLIDLVRTGIEMGTKTMHLGRTATEMKSTIGAEARGMKIYLQSPAKWRARGLKFFEPYFGSPEYTLRHPFRLSSEMKA